jgi:hypothetical protein
MIIALPLMLGGCTWQGAFVSPWAAPVAPVIPGFTAVPLGGGGFIEEPNSLLGGAGAPAEPPPSPIETVITGLEQAQKVRTLTRQLSR